jgi:hypothetical protein
LQNELADVASQLLTTHPAKPEQEEVWDDILKNPQHFFAHPDLVTNVFKNADISGWEYYPKMHHTFQSLLQK